MLQSYPSLGSLAKVYETLTVILEHPVEVEAYLREQDELWGDLRQSHPIPEEMLERFFRARELFRKSA
jgi:hypothetical protein